MSELNRCFDYIIIGSGIVGLSVAYALLQKNPKNKIAVLEKEKDLGMHASGRNSGVLHSGIYYREDSLKAKVCALGATRIKLFAKEYGIPLFNGGKVIVPTELDQYSTLDNLMRNAFANGIEAEIIDQKQLLELEPMAFPAEKSIYCPTTSVIDNKAVLNKLRHILEQGGVKLIYQCKVSKVFSSNKKLLTTQGEYQYQYLFNCAGAYADQIAKHEGLAHNYTLLPFKGIYYKMSSESASNIRSNIYPVPNIATPFLGVHFTRSINGDVYIGPTAIPVLGRENYYGLKGVRFFETLELISQLGKLFCSNENDFRNIAKNELMKYSKNFFYQCAKKLVPSLGINDLIVCSKAGIRPQLMNKKTKKLEMDYIFEQTSSSIHVLNAISPAFTSSFAFADMIVDKANIN